ncbi:phosphatidate cytidylyltransferase [Rhodobacter sp. JA431]|uniref:phosphatidate cytidylyltransferase n=1 Tax=Rhodobacter sp. JA431 TaxID=570013 RepID=UPI000BDBF7B0|nr:phosphatidate cytidylyltransferase [Rhodobacter sp. JA431]SOC08663.1 phosphatidate cytidylyltransferase [Rhodobacter sp. JA431]
MTAETSVNLIAIFAAVFAVLGLASAVGQVLRWRFDPEGISPVIATLNARIDGWWLMIIVLCLAFLMGQGAVLLLFAFASFSALREFLTLTHRQRADHAALVASFFFVLPVQYVSVWQDWYGFTAIFIPVYAFLGLPILTVLRADTAQFLTRVSETQWALMIAIYCVSHVPAFLTLKIEGFEGDSILLIVFLLFVVQSGDVLRYLADKAIGRHKIAPQVSQTKTWEGFAVGVLAASVIGAALWWITPFTPLQAFAMSLVLASLGFFGGLVMGAIKRDRGVREWGHMIEGHGGFLDRLDSVVFAAPVFFHLTRFFWQGA